MHAFAQDADAPRVDPSAAQAEAEPLGPKTPGADPPAPLAAPSQAAAEQPSIASAELERRGATIRAIKIIVDNVFDPEGNPEEDKALYRFANRVHVRTRPDVIQTALLFKSGDRYEGRVLDEAARALRARGFLADVRIAYRTYDPASNSVDVEVRVRDAWSLSLNAKLSHSGGKTEWGLGLDDDNFLGYGKELNVNYKSTIDRDESLLGYRDDNVLHTRMRLGAVFANASDGYRRELYSERPFYSLDARWMTGGQLLDQRRVDTMYDLGQEIDEFRHDIRDLTIRGGVSRGIVDSRTRRWLFGVSLEEDTFVPTERTPQPLLLPPDRKLVYPWIGWQLVADEFREMTELNDMGRTEDVALGINLFASIGFAEKSFGSDRDATLLRATVTRGWEPGTRDLLQLGAGTATRHERDGFKNSVTKVDARYYRRNSDNRLLSVSLERARDPRARSGYASAARRRQRPARLSDPLSGRREPGAVHRRAALLHGLLSVATVPLRVCGVLRRGPGHRPRSARVRAARHALRRGLRPAAYVTAREQRPDPAHRSSVPAQRAAEHRQRPADRRDEGNVLTLPRPG